MATNAVTENVENETLLAETRQVFIQFTDDLNNEILDLADTTVNGEVRITTAFVEYSRACIDHGFGLVLLDSMTELAKTQDVDPVFITELAALEAEKKSDSNKKALDFIKILRAEGFTTADIEDFTADIKQTGEYARLYGKAQALAATMKGKNE